MMIDLKNEGLKVVAWEVSFPLGIGRKVYEQEQAWANHTYGSGIVYHVEPLCRHSEALAGYAVRDARIAELELSAKRIYSEMLEANNSFARMFQAGAIKLTEERDQLRAELAEWSPVMQNLGDDNQQLRAKLDASKFCADVADDLRAELAAAKETISRYETTAENCEAFRDALAAIYAAPVAKQVVMPEALDRAFITGESCDGVYRVVIQSETLKEMQSVHNWIVRLNAADRAEGGQDE